MIHAFHVDADRIKYMANFWIWAIGKRRISRWYDSPNAVANGMGRKRDL